jgi:RNA polymerase sigma-70 factor (ECF subfamily)
MVNEAIAMLSPDDAEIITLFYKAEQNLEEISRILRLETNTAKGEITPGKNKIERKNGKEL